MIAAMVETMSSANARFDARSNLWWLVSAIGIGLLLLAYVIGFFNNFEDVRDEDKATAVFRMLGVLGLTGGLALGSLLTTAATWGVRLAMLLGSAVLLLGVTGVLNFVR